MKKRLSILLLSFAAALITLAASTENTQAASYFIDIHEFGPGKVSASAVAEAHSHELAVQEKHGIRFIKYWVDEENGRVYCLSSAVSAASIANAHREAHGLLPASILSVSGGKEVALTEGAQLFLDIHEFGAGNVTAKAVAEAHDKDLQVQSRFGVRFINYWVDEANGKVLCLSEAPSAEAVRETHRHAHGLLPQQIVKVTQGE